MNTSSNTCLTNDVPVFSECKSVPPKPMISTSNSSKVLQNYSTKPTSSGSETDVSTSTENLSPEEHYVLKTTIRQEPQGEETYLINDSLSLNNTLIIHENNSLNKSMYSFMSPMFYGKRNVFNENVKPEMTPKSGNNFFYPTITEAPPKAKGLEQNEKNDLMNMKNNLVSFIDNEGHYSNLNLIKFCNVPNQPSLSNSQLFVKNDSVIKLQSASVEKNSKDVTSNSASVNLQQPMLNNYLNSLKKKDSLMMKNFNENINLPPPPEYEKQWNMVSLSPNSKSYERLAISRSHPDLSKFDDEVPSNSNSSLIVPQVNTYNRNTLYRNNTLEVLLAENSTLRAELDLCFKKVHKLQKFEMEIQKVHQSHEELMRSSEKKEKLERAIRYKLEIEVRRLQDENRCLKDQLESNVSKNYEDVDSIELKKEINKRDVLITRFLTQNKELTAEKERQEIELQAQRLTLQEQRNHIEILDTALMNAQNNIITLETELRKKHGYEERTTFLEKALANLQLANERRLQTEKRVRAQLENEIEELKKQSNSSEVSTNGGSGGGGDLYKQNEKDVDLFKKMIREYEEKIISLEAEVSKWEQKYFEESTMRSIEVSAASAPKDAKIAALERTSQESEKIIAEARSEHMKRLEEIHSSNKKMVELEGKLKDMESKLAEKDAMIKVLQKHSEDRNAVLQKTMLGRRFPTRHTRSASTMGLVVSPTNPGAQLPPTPATVNADSSLPKDYKLLTNGNSMSSANTNLVISGKDSSNTNIDEQLKEIDSQLSNKDSIIKALRSEKERYPNHYNNWRL